MRVVNEPIFRILFEVEYPDTYHPDMSVDEMIEVLQKDGERLRRLRTYQQAQNTKHAWKTKRFNFMNGIHRFHRESEKQDVSKRIANRLKKYRNKIAFTGNDRKDNQYESVKIDLSEFDTLDFIHDLTLLENQAFLIASTFSLSETFVESCVFAYEVMDSFNTMKKALMEGTDIPFSAFETFLLTVEPELFEQMNESQEPLCSQFSKLVLNGNFS